MTYANVSIHFYLKKDAAPSLRGFPVFCRITYQRKKSELFTGEYCFPDRWNDAAGTLTRDPRLKEYLSHLEESLQQTKRQLEPYFYQGNDVFYLAIEKDLFLSR